MIRLWKFVGIAGIIALAGCGESDGNVEVKNSEMQGLLNAFIDPSAINLRGSEKVIRNGMSVINITEGPMYNPVYNQNLKYSISSSIGSKIDGGAFRLVSFGTVKVISCSPIENDRLVCQIQYVMSDPNSKRSQQSHTASVTVQKSDGRKTLIAFKE